MIIDVHCHLDLCKGIDKVIDRAKKARVIKIIANGIDFDSNRKCIALAKKYDIVECALGIYPKDKLEEECKEMGRKWIDFDVDKEIEWIRKQKPVAIGEIGMDFKGEADKIKQYEIFKKMIKLAKELDIPVIVHSRKAEKEVIEVLEEEKAKKVVMHCFSGKKKLVERIAKNKWMFSIPTNVVRTEQFQDIVKNVDINQLLCETDAPYLSPFKDKKNESSYVVESYKKIAEIKGMTLEEVEKNVFMNYKKLF